MTITMPSTERSLDVPPTPNGVHPVADLFPMLAADELAELAEDIKQRGLLHPIVLDGQGRVLDGRNRLAACGLVDVEPAFVSFDGDDSDGYALAVNIQRRNLTKGQQAMVVAKARSVSEQTTRSMAEQTGVSLGRVGQASTVVQHAPDMVDAVIAGATGLDEAYKVARQRKTEADSLENQLARLRAEDSELAQRVVEGELSLKAAWVEREQRAQRERQDIEAARRAAKTIATDLLSAASTIVAGCQLGETGLVTEDMLTSLRKAVALLEGAL